MVADRADWTAMRAAGTADRVVGVLAAIAGGDGSGRTAQPKTRGQLVGHRVFWTLFAVATLVLWLDEHRAGHLVRVAVPLRLLLSPLLLGVLWFVVLYWREPIRRRLRWLPLPPPVNYLLAGVPLVLLAVCCATGFGLVDDGDARLNVAREAGPWLALLIAVWFARRHYALSPPSVFWLFGVLGAVPAQDFALPVALWHHHWLTAVLLFVYAVPVYGGALALVLHVMPPEQLPDGKAGLDWRAVLLAAAAMAVAFTGVAWTWTHLVDVLAS
jgi:hypothetical protein